MKLLLSTIGHRIRSRNSFVPVSPPTRQLHFSQHLTPQVPSPTGRGAGRECDQLEKNLELFGLNFDRRSEIDRLYRLAGYFNRAPTLEVSSDYSRFRPIEIPTIVDGEDRVRPRHNPLKA